MNNDSFRYNTLALHWKLMFTGFVLLLGSGYLAAVLNAALSVGMTPQAIADHYADKSLSTEEIQIMEKQGFVEEEFSLDDEEDNTSKDEQPVNPAMQSMKNNVAEMNHNMSGMNHEMKAMSQGDDTLPPQILAQVSHVHLLVFSLLFIVLASLQCLTQLSNSIKSISVIVLFVALWGDIVSLNLVRFVSANFSLLTVVMGTLVGLMFAFIILRVLWELWLYPNKETSS